MKLSSIKLEGQSGATLIEVLVAVLILSFGMLSLGAMLSYSMQMPRLAAYRATASMLATSHVERMRANTTGFDTGAYVQSLTYNATLSTATPCTYPSCNANTIAAMDNDASTHAIRAALPKGGMLVTCNVTCSNREGDIWVIWLEPRTFAQMVAGSDECPDDATASGFSSLTPAPRCLHVRFKL